MVVQDTPGQTLKGLSLILQSPVSFFFFYLLISTVYLSQNTMNDVRIWCIIVNLSLIKNMIYDMLICETFLKIAISIYVCVYVVNKFLINRIDSKKYK